MAVKLARVPPSAIPEIVEFWSWLLPIVEEATTEPLPFTERRVFVKPVKVRFVVVPDVVVALVTMRSEAVEEAVETKPLLNSSVVEVAFSPVPSFTNG